MTISENGKVLLSDFDVLTDAGAGRTADVKVFTDIAPADDGLLHLRFSSSAGMAMLSGIEILPGVPEHIRPMRIVARDLPYYSNDSHWWSADVYFKGGQLGSGLEPASGTNDPELYETERWGHFSYAIPVAPGKYTLVLHFIEHRLDFPVQSAGERSESAGAPEPRIFDVFCNGKRIADHLNIRDQVGESRPLVRRVVNLLRGADLVEARQWAAANKGLLTYNEIMFLRASEEKQKAILREWRQARWLRIAFGIAIALLIAALFATWEAHKSAGIAKNKAADAENQKSIAEGRRREAAEAEKKSKESEQVAKDKAAEAERQKTEAVKEKAIADEKTIEAERQKTEAVKEKAIADEKTIEAERQTKIARSRQLAAAALLSKDQQQFDVAALLSLEAERSADTFEAHNLLLLSMQSTPRAYLYTSGPVVSVAFSPQGKSLATLCSNGALQLWDLVRNKVVGKSVFIRTNAKIYNMAVGTAAFSRDGNTLGLETNDGDLQLCALLSSEGICRRLGEASRSGAPLALTTNGRLLVSSADLWDVESGRFVGKFGRGDFLGVAFSPDGKLLAAYDGNSKTVNLWDVATRRIAGETFRGYKNSVFGLAFSPDGRILASGGAEGTVRLWDVVSRQELVEPLQGHTGSVTSVAFSPDGKALASASEDKTVRLWDVVNKGPFGRPLSGHTAVVTSVSFSPDGDVLASAGQDGKVALWDVSRWPLQLLNGFSEPLHGHSGPVHGIAFSPDGKLLASASEDNTVRLWSVASGNPIGSPLQGHKSWVTAVAFGPDGKLLASASNDHTVRLWEVDSGQTLKGKIFQTGEAPISSVIFTESGKLLVARDSSGSVFLWDVATGQEFLRSRVTGHVLDLVSSPDGKSIAFVCTDNTVQLLDIATRQLSKKTLPGQTTGVTSAAFSPDARVLALANKDMTGTLWDVATMHFLGFPVMASPPQRANPSARSTDRSTERIDSLAFSPNGEVLASASTDGTVALWDVRERKSLGKPLRRNVSDFRAATHGINSLAFSPDGKVLATVSKDWTVRLWDMATQQPLGDPFTAGPYSISKAVFSPDGMVLASYGDSTVRLWKVNRDSLAVPVCQMANRNLSQAEWDHHIGKNVPYRRTCPNLPDGEGVPSKESVTDLGQARK